MTNEELNESNFVIFIRKEKINPLNISRYHICVGKRTKENEIKEMIKEMATIGKPFNNFENAVIKAFEWSNDTGWPFVGLIKLD